MKRPLYIMFIDDSQSDRELFEKAIKTIDESIKCILVEEAYSALAYLTVPLGTLPDYIFLDINMPGMNGLECLHEIKKYGELQHIPVIMFTMAQVSSYEHTAKLLGAAKCFSKSMRFDENVSIIASVIGAKLPIDTH